jgi:DNA polymerase III subunit delta'
MPFKNILGHEKELNILKNAISGGKVAHSFLFSGPAGVGKKLTALAFAGALNCRDFQGDACGSCGDCRMTEAGNHPNLQIICPTDKDGEVTPEGLIRIDRIREIQNALRFKADGKKVVIVDGADRMQPAAANAFLKTLEEPPEGSVIILVSAHATELLPTILSRCQKLNFRPLPEGVIAEYLSRQRGLNRDSAETIARQSCGSISMALGSLDDAGERKELLERFIRIAPGDIDGALRLAEDLSKRDDLEGVLESIKVWYRDLAVSTLGEARLAVSPVAVEYAAREDWRFQAPWDFFSLVEGARRDIMPPRYANKQLTMEALILRLIEGRPPSMGPGSSK